MECANDGAAGLERAQSGDHAIVILDLLLPRLRGLDVDRILGLEIGADDYLPKPFNSRAA